MKLTELMEVANEGYPDEYLGAYFNFETGERIEATGDTLAEFVVNELEETFNPAQDADGQLATAIHALETAQRELGQVIAALEEKRDSL